MLCVCPNKESIKCGPFVLDYYILIIMDYIGMIDIFRSVETKYRSTLHA